MRKDHLWLALSGVGVFVFLLLTADGDFHESRTPLSAPPTLIARSRDNAAEGANAFAAAFRSFFPAAERSALAERFRALGASHASPAIVPESRIGDPESMPPAAAESDPAPAPVALLDPGTEVEALGGGRFRDRIGVFRSERALVTAYCPCTRCCGDLARGITSTGTTAWRPGAAADPRRVEYGTRVYVPGYGLTVVDDTGGAMRRAHRRRDQFHLDMRMTYHYEARTWGRQYLYVRVYEK